MYDVHHGKKEEVVEYGKRLTGITVTTLGCLWLGPQLQSKLLTSTYQSLYRMAHAPAGPFTIHFWAPASKWLISGASLMDYNRPVEKISIAQYTSLTLTGMCFSRYSLLVVPINYSLCGVNLALVGSSGWHLGRKVMSMVQ